jgi:O-antigen/teichoic acid export membrane protein
MWQAGDQRDIQSAPELSWMQFRAKALLPPRRDVLGWLADLLGDDALQRRLARGALAALVINVLGMAVGVLAQLVLARFLGTQGYGVYAYMLGWVNVLIVPAMIGFNTAQLRYVAAYRAREEWSLLRGITGFTDRLVPALGLACGLGGILTVWLVRDDLGPSLAQTLYVGLLIVPVLALMNTRAATVRALGRVVAAIAPDLLVRQLAILIGIGAVALLLPQLAGPVAAALVTLAAAVLSLGLISRAQRRAFPSAALQAPPIRHTRKWFATAVPLLLMASAQTVNAHASLLLLGWLGDTAEVGVYAIAARLADFLAFPLAMVNFVFAPAIAHLHAKDEHAALQRAMTATAWWTTAGGAAVGLPLFLFPGFFLALFGDGFVAGETALRIMLLAGLVHVATGSVGYLMAMTGLERPATVFTGTGALVNVGLAFLLIPTLGAVGGALAAAAGLVVWKVMAIVWCWRRLGIIAGIFASVWR